MSRIRGFERTKQTVFNIQKRLFEMDSASRIKFINKYEELSIHERIALKHLIDAKVFSKEETAEYKRVVKISKEKNQQNLDISGKQPE